MGVRDQQFMSQYFGGVTLFSVARESFVILFAQTEENLMTRTN